MKFTRFAYLSIAVLAVFAAPASVAQYASDFESLIASPAGVLLTDATIITPVGLNCVGLPPASQDCYYLPAAATSPFSVFNYVGNSLGVCDNPIGGSNFVAAQGGVPVPANILGRAQRELSTIGMTTATLRADVCIKYNGTAVTAPNNAASISFQPSAAAGAIPASKYMILLATWVATVAPPAGQQWNAIYVAAAGLGLSTTVNVIPSNLAFSNRPANRWNRWEVDVDFVSHAIIQIRITDLTTGITDVEIPATPRFLIGPLAAPNPIAYRLFAGQLGNVLAADNVCIDATGACPATPVLPVPALYQVDQPLLATLNINGVVGTPYCPATFRSSFAAATPVLISMDGGGPYDLAFDLGYAYPSSSPVAIVLPDAQIFNLNLLTCYWLSGPVPSPAFIGPTALGFVAPPAGIVVTAQVVAFGVGPLGVSLSQPATLVCLP